ncbi:MAG TPA: nuclear transport factor 2 family protein [Pyrinomonadaceae bacterium]
MRSRTINLCVLLVAWAALTPGNPLPEDEHEKRVREFVDAFNTREIDRMLSLVDENIQWLHIDGENITVNTNGKVALRDSMTRYFKSCASCKSSLEGLRTAGNRVTAMERASWTSKQGPKSQSSLSVYEFKDGKIFRVYYFPAEAAKTAP